MGYYLPCFLYRVFFLSLKKTCTKPKKKKMFGFPLKALVYKYIYVYM